jgi:hypothetical protein
MVGNVRFCTWQIEGNAETPKKARVYLLDSPARAGNKASFSLLFFFLSQGRRELGLDLCSLSFLFFFPGLLVFLVGVDVVGISLPSLSCVLSETLVVPFPRPHRCSVSAPGTGAEPGG